MITFINPAVAVIVGAIVLDEVITVWTLVGFVLVLAGCWLSTRQADPLDRSARATDEMVR